MFSCAILICLSIVIGACGPVLMEYDESIFAKALACVVLALALMLVFVSMALAV